MTAQTRTASHPYHHGNLRNALLQAGLGLTRHGGPEALGLRDVTRQVGVSPNAAYRHFADRDHLRAAVAERVRELMAERMRRAVPAAGDPAETTVPQRQLAARDRLRAVGLGYIGFALAEPGWFTLAFSDIATGTPLDQDSRGGPGEKNDLAAPLRMLAEALDDLVDAGALSPQRRRDAEWPCWSTVHGFALLALHGPLRGRPATTVQRAAEHSVDMIIDGLLRER